MGILAVTIGFEQYLRIFFLKENNDNILFGRLGSIRPMVKVWLNHRLMLS
jgi:hypothetical protein